MPTNVIMPQLGESVVEGTVSNWLKQEGDPVQAFEPLLEISTDKVDTEIPAPADGVLLQIHVPEGETVEKGTLLAVIGAGGRTAPTRGRTRRAIAQPAAEPVGAHSRAPLPTSPNGARHNGNARIRGSCHAGRRADGSRASARSGADRRAAGAKGAITKKDVEAYLATESAVAAHGGAPTAEAEQLPPGNSRSRAICSSRRSNMARSNP